MIDSFTDLDDRVDAMDETQPMEELVTRRNVDLFPESQLDNNLLERLRDSLTQRKHYLNPGFSSRRDWNVLRAWKGYVTRAPFHVMEQLVKYPLFSSYVDFLLGRSYSDFVEYLTCEEPTNTDVDDIERWRNLNIYITSTNSSTDKDKFMNYNVICEVKTEETLIPQTRDEERSQVWVACKRYREFLQLQKKLNEICKPLATIPFPSKTFVMRGTNPQVVNRRKEKLQNYLTKVLEWLKQEAPWVKGDSVSREWIQCSVAIDEFLAVTEMAPLYPKQKSDQQLTKQQKNKDTDFSMHPSVRDPQWFPFIIQKEVRHIYLSKMNTSLLALSNLFSKDNCAVETFDLLGVSSPEDELQSFLSSIIGCSSVKHLFLSEIHPPPEGALKELLAVLEHTNNRIERLFIGGWEVGGSLDQVALMLPLANHLQVLDLSHCCIDTRHVQSGLSILASCLRTMNLKELYLDENKFGDEGAICFAAVLRQNPALEILSMKHCKISPVGMIQLFNSLDHSKMNESVDVQRNREFANEPNKNLKNLYLSDMTMGEENSELIRNLVFQCASMLEHNDCLEELDLSGHHFDTESGLIIIAALKSNRTLKKLSLAYSKRNWHADLILLEFYSSNQSVKSFDLRNHMLAQDAPENKQSINHLTYSIPNDEIVRDLYVWNMRQADLAILCSGLRTNNCLELLDLSFVQFQQSVPAELITFIGENTFLKEISFHVSPDVDFHPLFFALVHSKLRAVTLSNLTREQGELFIRLMQADYRHSLERVALSFDNGNIYGDLLLQLDSLLPKKPKQTGFVSPSLQTPEVDN